MKKVKLNADKVVFCLCSDEMQAELRAAHKAGAEIHHMSNDGSMQFIANPIFAKSAVYQAIIEEPDTITEWLNTLPEAYRKLAIANLLNNKSEEADNKAEDLEDAINDAFWWGDTPEGDDFWRKVSYCEGDWSKLPKLPEVPEIKPDHSWMLPIAQARALTLCKDDTIDCAECAFDTIRPCPMMQDREEERKQLKPKKEKAND